MKIWCDVCSKKEASFFCSADEASLCHDCDSRVHQANKLASKHQRFSLFQPSSSSHLPHCDICQEKKGVLFCQQDRAILCTDCDESLHSANELTHKHDRFLLTGAKLSTIDLTENGFDLVPDFNSNTSTTQMDLISQNQESVNCGSTSSISEYLMEMLPGWQVEDLMNSSFSDPITFSKGGDELPFGCNDDNGLWVPQAPIMPSLLNPGFCVLKNGAEVAKRDDLNGRKGSEYFMDDGFTVPQIRSSVKRFRHAF